MGDEETAMTEEQRDLTTESPPPAGGGTGGGAPVPPDRKPSPILSFLFALVPGAGHMYMGLTQKGIQLMGLFFGSLFLSQHLFFLREFWPMVVAPATWFYSFFDALEISRRLKENRVVEDRPIIQVDRLLERGSLWGWVLIALGGLTLLERLFSYTIGFTALRRFLAPVMVPMVVIALGVYLLMQQRPRGEEGAAAAPEPEPVESAETGGQEESSGEVAG